ncbi:acyltransferase family protein [Chlamydia pneumoniae LPCoLN]|uniref:Acyltransferase family protein n=1 Tax=Chlamydia pneumoniae TaxID=83558 RepID=A0A0F7WSD5_CHLPN|nr:1-acyl-sn-glycerol-3-phosphate acyltransferase [Chlamydia pneumoniae]ACZ32850.1 acyltransferase family protein [Chlamydia pneumoniae LPCoLN]CRI43100.1 Acyltransferase family protein [Chlamydia pneumoniae]
MQFSRYLRYAFDNQYLPEPLYQKFSVFHQNYIDAATKKAAADQAEALCLQWVKVIIEDLKNPFIFPPYHKKIRAPIDLFRLSIDFFSLVIDDKNSRILNLHRLKEIEEYIARGDNVVLLANHQTECDPQLMYYALGKTHPELMENMIFVAGDRVTSDPLARPFSMGCDLLCIYSKRHIATPPELREEKLLHNQKSMQILKTLLNEGGKFIYVAPAGGRDRKNAEGKLYPSEFSPESIEMFRLLAKASNQTTHFYPFALKTYDILPPPPKIENAIGEQRAIFFAPVFFNFGAELFFDALCSKEELIHCDKHAQRTLRAEKVFSIVKNLYEEL